MGRHKAPEGGTRDKIKEAALRIFMEKGYENTTVRMILDESQTVAGSFYHYYSSKEALFEAAVELFLSRHVEQVAEIAENKELTVSERFVEILAAAEQNSLLYKNELGASRLHWTMEYCLHKKAMQAIAPEIEKLLAEAIASGEISNPLGLDAGKLARVLLNGVEGILHAEAGDNSAPEKLQGLKAAAMRYAAFVTGMAAE